MPDAEEMRAYRCAGCGAPFEAAGGSRCTFCGAVLRRPTELRTVQKPPPPSPAPPASPWSWTGRQTVYVYAATFAVPLILGAFSLWRSESLTRTATSLSASRPARSPAASTAPTVVNHHIGRPLLAVGAGRGEARDLVTTIEGATPGLALFDGTTHELRWRAGPFTKTIDRASVVADADNLYVIEDPNLSAFSLRDGSVRWRASLATSFSSQCQGCLRATNGRVIVLQKDGTLQAFDAASGQVAWSQRLARTPGRLPLAGPWLVALGAPQGRDEVTAVEFLDPLDGKVARRVQPSCLNKAFHRPESPRNDSPLFFEGSSDGAHTLYAAFGFFSHCVQAFSIDDGKKLWSTSLDEWDTRGWVQGDRALYYPLSGRGIVAIDRRTGKATKLPGETEHDVFPVLATGGVLVARAAPTWDGSKGMLWGLEAATGRRLWSFQLSAKSRGVHDLGRGWAVFPAAAGVALIQQLDDATVGAEVINAATGVSGGRRLIHTGQSSLYEPVVEGGMAWLDVLGGVGALSLDRSQLAYELQ